MKPIMRPNKKVLCAGLLLALLAASPVLAAQTGSAADRAYNNGYQAGYKMGRADAQAAKPLNYAQTSAYRRSTDGWREASSGDLEQYRANYRAGFADGYQEGYKAGGAGAPAAAVLKPVPPPPAPPPAAMRVAADEAFGNGYREGYALGKRDAPGNYRPGEAAVYKDAEQGYDAARFPSQDDYKFNFRQGFEYGYDDGFHGRASDPRRNILRKVSSQNIAGATAPAPASSGTPLSLPEGTTLRLRLNNTISTRSSRQGDRFTATVSEPVYVQGTSTVAIPAGSTVTGVVSMVERPGRVKGVAQLHLRYETLTPPGGKGYTLQASTVSVQDKEGNRVDEGEGTVKGKKSTGRDAATVGGTSALGAIIGGIAGGGKGAAIGAGVGAGVGTGGVLATRGKEIDLASGTPVEIRLLQTLELRP
jgi:hypothetical protein